MARKKDPHRERHKRDMDRLKQKAREREFEKDTAYFLVFTRKGSTPKDPSDQRYFPRINLAGNPQVNSQYLTSAMIQFARDHNAATWEDIAESYEILPIWLP